MAQYSHYAHAHGVPKVLLTDDVHTIGMPCLRVGVERVTK